jgi:hypothetical protein
MMKKAETNRKHGILAAIKNIVDEAPKPVVQSTKDLPSTKAALRTMSKAAAAEKAQKQAEKESDLQTRLIKARSTFDAEYSRGHKKPDPRHRLADAKASPAYRTSRSNPVTAARQAVNMELAQSGNAFSVATLSQLANRPGLTGSNEVIIPLH